MKGPSIKTHALPLAAALLLWCVLFFCCCASTATAMLPVSPLQVTYCPTIVEGDANSYGSAYFGRLEWDTPSTDAILCQLYSADAPNLDPVCFGGAGGDKNKYFAAPMVQAGWDTLDDPHKPMLSLLYAKKECKIVDQKCGDCRLCVLAVANRGPDGFTDYLPVDPSTGENWVKVNSGNVIEAGRTDGTEFAPLLDSTGKLIGFEGCTAPGLRFKGDKGVPGDLVIPPTASRITLDAHLNITYPAGQPQTSRVIGGGHSFDLLACSDNGPDCVAPEVTSAFEETGDCFASDTTADYLVTIDVKYANEPAVTKPDECTLEPSGDGRVDGTGQLTYRCTGLARGETASLAFKFTAKSEPACTRTITETVTINVPQLEDLELKGSPACLQIPGTTQSGNLEFMVTAKQPLADGQLSVDDFSVTDASNQKTTCTAALLDNKTTIKVTCSNLAAGKYTLSGSVRNTQRDNCPHKLKETITGWVYKDPTVTAPEPKTVCATKTADFDFAVDALGSTGLKPMAGCTVTGTADGVYSVQCLGVAATTTVNVAAQYGSDCTSAATPIELTVNTESLTVTDVSAAGAKICPEAPSGTVSFGFTTDIAAATSDVTGTLWTSDGLTQVTGATCIASGSTDKKTWTVTCSGAPAPGEYKLHGTVKSELGCTYAFELTKFATVSKYAYTVNAGADPVGLSACTGAATAYTFTVTLSADLAGATVTAVPSQPTLAACAQVTTTDGSVLFKCDGLPAGTKTTVTVTATKTDCSVSDTVDITVVPKECGGPTVNLGCYTRTIGYWSTHGEEMKPWVDFTLWEQKFTADDVTASANALSCISAKPDALRVLCVTGQRVCPDAQLARQCIAARVNLAVTTSCGSTDFCFKAGGLTKSRLDQCCGTAYQPRPPIAACIDDISAFNEDKTQVGTCANGNKLPAAGPGATQKVCNDFSQAFARSTNPNSCERGFCAAAPAFGRRLLHA